MTPKRERGPIRWVQHEVGGDYDLEVDDVEVATIGDKSFTVSAMFDFAVGLGMRTGGRGNLWVSGSIRVLDGRPAFSRVLVEMDDVMTPSDMQSIRWATVLEGALAKQAGGSTATAREVRAARQRASNAERARRKRSNVAARQSYQTHSPELFAEVLRLRAEAEKSGVRYDSYIGERLGYSASYVRRLAGKAKDWAQRDDS